LTKVTYMRKKRRKHENIEKVRKNKMSKHLFFP